MEMRQRAKLRKKSVFACVRPAAVKPRSPASGESAARWSAGTRSCPSSPALPDALTASRSDTLLGWSWPRVSFLFEQVLSDSPYGFRQAWARRYEREDRPTIVVDVFDMGRSDNAFGIFSFEREGREAGFGQGSEYYAGFMRFWKGPFLVSMVAQDETPEVREVMFALAKALDLAIAQTGPPPAILALLPEEGLIPERVRYFRHHALLNYHYYVAEENILHLGERTEAVLASYADTDRALRLLLVRYASAEEATSALVDFLQAYLPDGDEAQAIQTENGRWTVAWRDAALVAAVFDASSRARAESVFEALRAKEEESRR